MIFLSILCAVVTSPATTTALTGFCVCSAKVCASWYDPAAPTILNAGGAGSTGSGTSAGNGGNGLTTTLITSTQATTYSVGEVDGSAVYFAGGGGGGAQNTNGTGGLGGGGNEGQNGTANTGGGAGGSFSYTSNPSDHNGGSGVIIAKFPDTFTITVGAGLTSSTVSDPPSGYKIEIFTAGTGDVSFAQWVN